MPILPMLIAEVTLTQIIQLKMRPTMVMDSLYLPAIPSTESKFDLTLGRMAAPVKDI